MENDDTCPICGKEICEVVPCWEGRRYYNPLAFPDDITGEIPVRRNERDGK